jgi:hypothetical protein
VKIIASHCKENCPQNLKTKQRRRHFFQERGYIIFFKKSNKSDSQWEDLQIHNAKLVKLTASLPSLLEVSSRAKVTELWWVGVFFWDLNQTRGMKVFTHRFFISPCISVSLQLWAGQKRKKKRKNKETPRVAIRFLNVLIGSYTTGEFYQASQENVNLEANSSKSKQGNDKNALYTGTFECVP